jgi:perosamine synthetase
LNELVNKKREIWQMYRERLADLEDIELNAEPDGVHNSVWITGLVFGKSHNLTKQDAIARLGEIGIPARPFFYPLSSLPAYPGQEERYRPLNPVAYDLSARGINLPGALNLTKDQIDAVCDGIKTVVGQSRSALVGSSG